jgi:Ca2+-binding EF-hand superfamily protein
MKLSYWLSLTFLVYCFVVNAHDHLEDVTLELKEKKSYFFDHDKNNDTYWSLDEIMLVYEKGEYDGLVASLFGQMDENNDGKISFEEYLAQEKKTQ